MTSEAKSYFPSPSTLPNRKSLQNYENLTFVKTLEGAWKKGLNNYFPGDLNKIKLSFKFKKNWSNSTPNPKKLIVYTNNRKKMKET